MLTAFSTVSRFLTCSALLLVLTTGCSTMNLSMPFAKKDTEFPVASKENPAVEVMALWQPGEGRDTKGLPSRGFAGQLFFFQRGNETPVKVDGDVRVYLFDDEGTDGNQGKPLHIYQFIDGTWNQYLTHTNLGPAYQVFIPYPRKGSHQANCSLRVKYVNEQGATIYSDPADLILLGSRASSDKETFVAVSDPSELPKHQMSDPNQTIRIVNNKVQVQSTDAQNLASQNSASSQVVQAGHSNEQDISSQLQRIEQQFAQMQTQPANTTSQTLQMQAMAAELARIKQHMAQATNASGIAQSGYEQPQALTASALQPAGNRHPLSKNQPPQVQHQYRNEQQLSSADGQSGHSHPLKQFSEAPTHLNVYTWDGASH